METESCPRNEINQFSTSRHSPSCWKRRTFCRNTIVKSRTRAGPRPQTRANRSGRKEKVCRVLYAKNFKASRIRGCRPRRLHLHPGTDCRHATSDSDLPSRFRQGDGSHCRKVSKSHEPAARRSNPRRKQDRYRAVAGSQTLKAGAEIPLEKALCLPCIRNGQVFRCGDVDPEFLIDSQECRRRGIQSLIAVPIFHEAKLPGDWNSITRLKTVSASRRFTPGN